MALGTTQETWFQGQWRSGNTPILGAADHGTWQGTMVFDGARAFEGVIPDLDLHCQRIVSSARAMAMEPPAEAAEIAALIRDGVARFPRGSALYLRPMMWSTEGSAAIIDAEPGSTEFAICLEDLPLPDPSNGIALTVSPYRRPRQDTAVTEAKAACLYPNNARIVREARSRGFHNALSLDLEGHVAETASTNVFYVRDGVVFTPVPNGTFLAGITRMRSIALLRSAGVEVVEAALTVEDFASADEIFVTGNASKVMPVTRFDERDLPYGPVTQKLRGLYWAYAHEARVAAE
ncbi:MAG: branched-chain amino acid aminotransferase [Pseudomonadota bacterium]